MPRQIIDTESSRPRYVRRIAAILVAGLLVVAAAVIIFARHFPGK